MPRDLRLFAKGTGGGNETSSVLLDGRWERNEVVHPQNIVATPDGSMPTVMAAFFSEQNVAAIRREIQRAGYAVPPSATALQSHLLRTYNLYDPNRPFGAIMPRAAHTLSEAERREMLREQLAALNAQALRDILEDLRISASAKAEYMRNLNDPLRGVGLLPRPQSGWKDEMVGLGGAQMLPSRAPTPPGSLALKTPSERRRILASIFGTL